MERPLVRGGHAANAITRIAFWNTRYELGWAEPLLYAAAVGVGLARVLDEAQAPPTG